MDIATLSSSLDPAARNLLTRYVVNAAHHPSRRAIKTANAHCKALLDAAGGPECLAAAGFVADDATLRVPDAALVQLQQAAHALQLATAAANLLALPDELVLRCLVTASLADLAAAARTCRGLRDAAHTGCLWLRHCSRRFWRESRGVADQLGRESWAALSPIRGAPLGPPLPAPSAAPAAVDRHALEAAVDWRLVCRAERLWADLKARAGRSGTVGLRAGLPLHALLALPADFRSRLPPELRASMLVHDGEETTAGAGGGVEGCGLWFGGARLLPAAEMVDEVARAGDGAPLPLTTRQGFQQLALAADGRVILAAGFNEIVKAGSRFSFLERVMSDTV